MTSLPIDEVIPVLRAALAAGPAVVLQAPPGAGKTTGVPPALLDEPWLAGQSILMLEPRRLAARAAATRIAGVRNEAVGDTAGYRIRFESRISKHTRIEVVTEGILTRRLQADPGLSGVGLVIFDEFHERHLHADLALALCLDAQRGLREDLKLLVMSATLDDKRVSRLLGDAPIVTSEGRSFSVDIRYLSHDPDGPLSQVVGSTIESALARDDGDVLAFLPGAREIRRTQERLEAALGDRVDVLPLYGDLPWETQVRAIRPGGGRRRVVLATPIAETSLTIEGIRVVVDSGQVRVPRFDPVSGLSRLVTQRVSRAAADQRAGRAGRLAPGICYRLWGETTQRGLVADAPPEILTADLAPLALELAAWGVQGATQLVWLDPPPAAALAQARDLLFELDALDATGRITATGRAMVKLPLHPRLAHMLTTAETNGLGHLACDVAALLSERDVFTGPSRRAADFVTRLEALHQWRGSSRRSIRRDIDPAACRHVEQAARQYRKWLAAASPVAADERNLDRAGLLLAFAYPDRIALQRAPGESRYLLASGRGARLHDDEMRLRQPCLVAARLDAGETEGLIHLAAPVTIETLEAHLGRHVREEDVVCWDAQQQAVIARRERRLGALVFDAKPLADATPERLRRAMSDGIRALGPGALPWTREARDWQARVQFLRRWWPDDDWPDVSDTALLATLADWLDPYLDGMTRREHLARLDLLPILETLLDWPAKQRLDALAPARLEVPSGSRRRLDYAAGEVPVLRVRLQEMFGCADTPCVAGGRVPVILHLLSPAQRPIQVTRDLRGFWNHTYAEVRKELKGRYPKHPWPDDPWNARPTARTRRRQIPK